MKKILFVIGTRPEAIKLCPVIAAFKNNSSFQCIICSTGQHKELLTQVLKSQGQELDYDLQLMQPDQSLSYLTSQILIQLRELLINIEPDLLFVQGDTTSAMAAGLAGFYYGCRVGHVEAGLRTYNTSNPYPEEVNRQMLGRISTYHFSPTLSAYGNLIQEKVDRNNIAIVGNTSVDALMQKIEQLKNSKPPRLQAILSKIETQSTLILATTHRRENQGPQLLAICQALKTISDIENVNVLIPVHPNPKTKTIITEHLGGSQNIQLLEPVDHLTMVGLIQKATIVITDSGGIQEETPYLGIPTIVTRINTERTESCVSNNAILIGPDKGKIIREVQKLLSDKAYYLSRSQVSAPYGTGDTAQKILDFIKEKML